MAAAKRCSKASARDPVADLAHAGQREPRGVDVVSLDEEVDDRRQYLLRVVAKRDVPVEQHRLLPGAVEQQHVVAALEASFGALAPAATDRAVAAVVHDEGRALHAGFVGAEEPPRHA